MNKTLVLLALFGLMAVVTSQWDNNGNINNNNPFNNGQLPIPNFPQIDCNAPGAHCETKEMVCDGRGHCVEKSSKSGSSMVEATNVIVLIACGLVAAMKMY